MTISTNFMYVHYLDKLYVLFIPVGFSIVYLLVRYALASQRPENFPPGPKPLPFIGNLHQFPPTKAFLKFQQLEQQYGSIIGMKLGAQNVVVLNEWRHVQELFDKQGSIYSDRPPSHIANDLIYQDRTHILFLPYGKDWKVLRKVLQDILRPKNVDAQLPLQNAEATQTLYQLLEEPAGWYDHIRRSSTAIVLASVFGLRGASFDSPRVKDFYHVSNQVTQILEVGATPPVDIFPFLKLLPDFMCPWRKWARSIRAEHQRLWFRMVAESKENQKRPDAPECFLQGMFADAEKNGLDDVHIAYLAGSLVEAGSDSTASTLLSFMLAMAKYPEVLKKCQTEVDRVCGNERTPNIEDLRSLPYVIAVMNETLRWRPVAAGGIPHATTQDDYYQGYFIPKGTMVLANTWAIHRTDEFTNPEAFDPDRFMNNKFGTRDTESDDRTEQRRPQYIWGAGRRVCSGQRLAENSLILSIAKICWSFNVTSQKDIDASVETGYYGGFLIWPKQHALDITPRSNKHTEIIRQEYEAELPFLSRFKD